MITLGLAPSDGELISGCCLVLFGVDAVVSNDLLRMSNYNLCPKLLSCDGTWLFSPGGGLVLVSWLGGGVELVSILGNGGAPWVASNLL